MQEQHLKRFYYKIFYTDIIAIAAQLIKVKPPLSILILVVPSCLQEGQINYAGKFRWLALLGI
jgi:hypothetical protein